MCKGIGKNVPCQTDTPLVKSKLFERTPVCKQKQQHRFAASAAVQNETDNFAKPIELKAMGAARTAFRGTPRDGRARKRSLLGMSVPVLGRE